MLRDCSQLFRHMPRQKRLFNFFLLLYLGSKLRVLEQRVDGEPTLVHVVPDFS